MGWSSYDRCFRLFTFLILSLQCNTWYINVDRCGLISLIVKGKWHQFLYREMKPMKSDIADLKKDVKRTGTPRITSSGAAAVTRGRTPTCENSLQKTVKHFNIGHVGFLETALKIVFKISYHHEISRWESPEKCTIHLYWSEYATHFTLYICHISDPKCKQCPDDDYVKCYIRVRNPYVHFF